MSWVFIFRANLTKSICAARCWGDMKRCRYCVSGFLGSSSSLPVPSCRTPHKHLKRTVWRWNKTGHLTPLITSPSITQRHWSWAQDSIMASSPLPCRKSRISITITIILFLFFMLLQKLEEKAASLRWKTRRWVTSSGTSVQIKANSDKTKTEILPAHRKSRSDNMNQSSWKLPDFFFFFQKWVRDGQRDRGGWRKDEGEEGRRKEKSLPSRWTDGLTGWTRGGDGQGKKELLSLFLMYFRIKRHRKKKIFKFFIGPGGDGTTRSSCQWVFFLGFSKSATCPNLEDAVYSWGRDKPAAPAPPPSEQSGHYQRTKKEHCTATSIWFWLEHIQRLCEFY